MCRARIIAERCIKCSCFLFMVAFVLLAPPHAMADPRGIGEPPEPLTPESAEARRLQQVADIRAWLPRLVGHFRYEGVVDLNGDMESTADAWSEQFRDAALGPLKSVFDKYQEEKPESPGPAIFADWEKCGAGNASADLEPCKVKRAHGTGDCVAIGSGPGVHCVFDVTWQGVGELGGSVIRGEEPFLSPATTLYGIDANTTSVRYLTLDREGLTESETAVLKGDTLRWVFYTGEGKTTRRITTIRARPGGSVVQTAIEFEELLPLGGWRRVVSIVFDGRRVVPDADADDS